MIIFFNVLQAETHNKFLQSIGTSVEMIGTFC